MVTNEEIKEYAIKVGLEGKEGIVQSAFRTAVDALGTAYITEYLWERVAEAVCMAYLHGLRDGKRLLNDAVDSLKLAIDSIKR